MFWVVLAFCPVVLQQIFTGGNHLANGLLMLVLFWWMTQQNQPIAAVLFGLGLSSRANFLLLAPLALFYLRRQYGYRRAVRDVAIAGTTFLIVTLPFYLYDPKHLKPLEAADRLTVFDKILPHLGVTVGAVGLVFTIWLAARGGSLLANSALVQAFFVVIGTVLSGDLFYASYGLFFLFFAGCSRAGSAPWEKSHWVGVPVWSGDTQR